MHHSPSTAIMPDKDSCMHIQNPPKLREWLARKLTGLIYRLDNSANTFLSENGEERFIREIGALYAGKDFVFFDIGANVGEYTELVLRLMGAKAVTGHLFEPQATCVSMLNEKFSNDPRVSIQPYALSNTEGVASLYKDADTSGLSSLHKRDIAHYGISLDTTETISLKTGRSYVEQNRIPHIHLMKIDVEGHEILALEGFGDFLSSDKVDFIQFEYGGANLDSHTSLLQLFRFFTDRGFVVCKVMKHCLERRTYEPRLENFVYQNYVAVSPRMMD